MTRSPHFDVQSAIAAAWDVLWADNLRRRAEGHDFRGDTYHLTARDLETQVRRFAEDTLAGRPWTKDKAWPGFGGGVRFRGDLQATVRRWLRGAVVSGRLESHNFGRGHVSGERFRPRGEPLSAAEAATIEKIARRRADPRPVLIHFSKGGHGGTPMCVAEQRRAAGRRVANFGRSRAHSTRSTDHVTCPRCLKLMPACERVAS